MRKVAAIVVTHNNEKTIDACLESLIRHRIKTIIVVDNASTDGTKAVVNRFPVSYIQQGMNTGFASAVNKGVSTSTGYGLQGTDYILLLNPDAVLEDPIDPATNLLDTDKKVGIIGLGLYDKEGKLEKDSFGSEPTLFELFARRIFSTTHNPQPTTSPDWVSGGAMVIRADIFQQLNGFDRQFFLYWEDVDMCRRARDMGASVALLPSIHVAHARGVSLTDTRKKAVLYDQSADRYFRKHYAAPIWIFQRLLRYLYRLLWPQAR